MLRKLVIFLVGFTLIVGMSYSNLSSSAAQNIYPPVSSSSPQQDAEGRWYMPPGHVALETHALQPQATGGPDQFGYTWDDSIPISWIDATGGTDTGLNGYSSGDAVGPIPLPFAFNFYENAYPELWINAGGYLAFSIYDAHSGGPWGTRFPEPGHPSNMIAPLWSTFRLSELGPTNRIYYQSGGITPNRYFVVEWYQVAYANPPSGGAKVFTYEVILYENGDIRFQYQTISSGSYWCDDVAIGMENANGYDGLTYLDWCQVPPSGRAVHFTRPADSARVLLLNPYDGTFTQPHKFLDYELEINNNGTFGTDSYNLTTTSTWDLFFKNADGVPLTDTNADGIVDTGPLAQGAEFVFIAEVQTPTIINPTDQNNMVVTITSSINASKYKVATLSAAVPVPFAQSFDESGMGLYLVQPGGQQRSIISEDWGEEMAIDETPAQGFVYLWTSQRYLDENYSLAISEIGYTILDSAGQPIRTISKLVDHSGATIDTYDDNPTVAVAPNGSIGVLWDRWLINDAGQRNYNIYFAILGLNGDLSYGPVNMTNNDVWGGWNDLNIPQFSSAGIAATDNNRFFLSWYHGYEASENDWVSNVAYTIRDTNGGEIKPPAELTDDSPGAGRQYYSSSVGQAVNQQVMVAFSRVENNVSDLYYIILDSDGNVIKSMTNLSNDGASSYEVGRTDIEKFKDGNIAVAWNTRDDTLYTVLDTSFNRIVNPTSVSHPAERSAGGFVTTYLSLAADPTGHVALTWADPDRNNSRRLYYALLNSNGTIQTPPMIFLSSDYRIVTGAQGYASTSYTFDPTTSGVDTNIHGPAVNLVPPNGTVDVPIQFGNNGSALATSVTITATLGSGLTYVGDNSGVTPIINTADTTFLISNTQYTWPFSTDMAFLSSGQFDLSIGIGNVGIGTSYPMTITISSAENDEITSNNTYTLSIVAATQIFLPLVTR
jgi:hypothetical protein